MIYIVAKHRKNFKSNWCEGWIYSKEDDAWERLRKEEEKDKDDEYDLYITESITFGKQISLF